MDRTGVVLSLSVGTLFIYGVHQNRAWVIFQARSSEHDRHGALVDEAYSDKDGGTDSCVGGEVTPIPLYATVSKEMATKVATYFLEHSDFPQDVQWRGSMKWKWIGMLWETILPKAQLSSREFTVELPEQILSLVEYRLDEMQRAA